MPPRLEDVLKLLLIAAVILFIVVAMLYSVTGCSMKEVPDFSSSNTNVCIVCYNKGVDANKGNNPEHDVDKLQEKSDETEIYMP